MIHGRRTDMVLDFNEYPHDANWTINCLLHSLSKEVVSCSLPPVLYVQLDNCWRENKNKYFLGMMGLLVKRGVIREVVLSFLMVGHTHEGTTHETAFIHLPLQPLKLTYTKR